MEKLPGSTYLKVVGIIYLIFGVIAAISLFAMIAMVIDYGFDAMLAVALVLSILIVALDIIAGIFGIRYNNSREKAGFLFNYGIALLIVVIVNLVVGAMMSGLNILGIIGIILPILFLVGSYKNKQAA